MKLDKRLIRIIVVLIAIAAYIGIISNLSNVEKTEMVSMTGTTYERAVVREVTKDNLTDDGQRVGYQQLKVELLTGEHKGELLDATSSEGNLFGAVCEQGDKVIVMVCISDNNSTVSVYSKDRIAQIVIFVAVFLLLICVIGGKNGVKSVLGLIFTFVSIIYMFMPLVYRGVSPFAAAVIVVIITTIVTMYLIGGVTVKTVSAVAGTTLGVLIAGISAALFGYFADIDGYNVSNIETLVYVGQNTKIQIGSLLFAGILIASLGAVMDVAMSVSSAINEINEKSPDLSSKDLFKSGLNVGRDMMGTMSNTLILAFVGGSLSTLVINYAYDLPFLQIINSYSIGIEIMQGIAGSLGVILTVPSVAAITAILLKRKKNPNSIETSGQEQ